MNGNNSENNSVENITANKTNVNADINSDINEVSVSVCDGNESETNSEKPKSGVISNIYDILEMFAACAAAILIAFTFIARLTVVDGPSMNKTLTDGDYVIVSSLGYKPERGDIVVVQDPTARGYTKPLIKRLIAVGGDTVDIDFSTWTVTVNGEVLDESEYLYLADDAVFTSNYKFPITVEEGNIFVMGDNRNHSADSRLSAIGQIDERCLVGRAVLRILPFNSIRIFD